MERNAAQFADDLLWFKQLCQDELPKGLSITWHGQLHLWPSAYRPANETFEDTMRYTLSALVGEAGPNPNVIISPAVQQKAIDAVKE